MKYEIKEVKIDGLEPAPWNPRKEITPESVADLAANISANGVLQNIGVWADPDTGKMYIIYGNRRVVACRVAGIASVMAKVYQGTEIEARERTRSENELRLGIDPLEDSKLLCSMRDAGRTEKEIAAHFGLPIATVCRRLKLADLSPSIREVVSKGVKITTDALERLSAYPVEIQDAMAAMINGAIERGSNIMLWDWDQFDYKVDELTMDLDNGKAFEDCSMCAMRTGATPDLFGEVCAGGLGRCLNPECYKRHRQDVIKRRIEDAIDPDVHERVKLRDGCEWMLEDCGATKGKPDPKNPCAYYVVKYDGSVKVKYGPSKAARKEEARRKKEKVAEEKAKSDAEAQQRQAICKKVAKWCHSNLYAELKKYAGDDPWRVVDLSIRFNTGQHFYGGNLDDVWAKWTKRRSFENWYKLVAIDNMRDYMDDRRISIRKACRVVKFLRDVKWGDVLTKDELAAIRANKFKNY